MLRKKLLGDYICIFKDDVSFYSWFDVFSFFVKDVSTFSNIKITKDFLVDFDGSGCIIDNTPIYSKVSTPFFEANYFLLPLDFFVFCLRTFLVLKDQEKDKSFEKEIKTS